MCVWSLQDIEGTRGSNMFFIYLLINLACFIFLEALLCCLFMSLELVSGLEVVTEPSVIDVYVRLSL